MKIVVDTNILVAIAMGEPERQAIIRLTVGADLYAPEVLPFEIGNALSALMRKKILEPGQVVQVWDTIQSINIELRRVNIRSALQLATQFNIYAYDAYFLECARSLGSPLLTLDQQLQSVAKQRGIPILEVPKK